MNASFQDIVRWLLLRGPASSEAIGIAFWPHLQRTARSNSRRPEVGAANRVLGRMKRDGMVDRRPDGLWFALIRPGEQPLEPNHAIGDMRDRQG